MVPNTDRSAAHQPPVAMTELLQQLFGLQELLLVHQPLLCPLAQDGSYREKARRPPRSPGVPPILEQQGLGPELPDKVGWRKRMLMVPPAWALEGQRDRLSPSQAVGNML